MGELPDGQNVICGPSNTAAMCASARRGKRVNFELLSLDPADEVFTPLFDLSLILPPSPFYYISVNGTLYFMATSETYPSIFLGGVVSSVGAVLHQHVITELQGGSLSDMAIGPVATTANGLLLVLSLGTTLHLIPLSDDFHATKEALTINGESQDLDWNSPSDGGNAALGQACPSAWRLIPDESTNTILVVCKDRLQQLKLNCSGPHFTHCLFEVKSQNATAKFPNALAEILHETDDTAVCYVMLNQKGFLSYMSSAFPFPLEGLMSAPLMDEDTEKMLQVIGGLCSPSDGQGSVTFFVNKDGELYKLASVSGAPKCKKLGLQCASCSISACRRDPAILALNDEVTGVIKIFDLVTKHVHSTSIPAVSNLTLFGWHTEHSVITITPSTTSPGVEVEKAEPDSMPLEVGLSVASVVAVIAIVTAIAVGIVIALIKCRTGSTTNTKGYSQTLPVQCTGGDTSI